MYLRMLFLAVLIGGDFAPFPMNARANDRQGTMNPPAADAGANIDGKLNRYLVRELGLERIPAKLGGGYRVFTRFGNGTEDALSELLQMPRVRAFVFDDEFSAKGWKKIGQLRELEVLECYSVRITDEDLRCLHSLPQLEKLVLKGHSGKLNPFTERSLQSLRRMRGLKQLVLHSRQLNDKCLAHVGSVRSLRSLELHGVFTDAGIAELNNLKKLEHLELKGHFTDAGLSRLAELSKLKSLVLSSPGLHGRGLVHLGGLERLEVLKLETEWRRKTTLAPLTKWPALKALNLASPGVNDELLTTLRGAPHLKSLTLAGSHITDEGVKDLKRFQSLEEVNLQNTPITNDGIESLTALTKLRVLVLGHSSLKRITGKGVQGLSKLPKLEKLNITYVSLQPDDVQTMAEFAALKSVNLVFRNKAIRESWQQVQKRHRLPNRVAERIFVRADAPDLPSFGDVVILTTK